MVLSSRRARNSGLRRRRVDQVGASRQDAGLRAAQQLVAAEGDQARAGGEALRDQRLLDAEGPQIGHAAAAQVLVNRQIALASQRSQLRQGGPRGESPMRKLLGWTRSSRRVRSVMRVAIILDAGAVGGADLAQNGARAGHDVGDAEAVADLDQLAARDHHLRARRQFVQRQEDRGGVVVDGDGGGAQQPFEQGGGVHVALAAAPRGQVVFQVGITRR